MCEEEDTPSIKQLKELANAIRHIEEADIFSFYHTTCVRPELPCFSHDFHMRLYTLAEIYLSLLIGLNYLQRDMDEHYDPDGKQWE